MKKFQFKFRVLEKNRKDKESESLRLLAEKQRDLQEIISRKLELQSQLQASLARRESLGIVATPVHAFQIEELNIAGLKQRLIQADHLIAHAEKRVEKARQAYMLARQKRMIISKLHEKHLQDFKKRVAKLEQKQLDELATMRFQYNQEEGNA